MEATSFLIFRLRASHYAVEASAVREVVPLPELISLEESPRYIVGVIDLRGELVPVIDLNVRFGRAPQRYRLEDCVIVLERAGSAIGIIVNEMQDVRDIAPEACVPVPSYGAEAPAEFPFLMGLAKSGEQVVMLLHLEHLLSLEQSLKEGGNSGERVPPVPLDAFCPDADPQERAVFHERARSLAQRPESRKQSGLLSLAIVRLGEEFFGIALQAIREFIDLRSVTPVPCCPEHIVGQMNLRGDLITVIDIAGALGLPPVGGQISRNVVVLNNAKLGAGVLVDEVLDVLYLHAADVAPAPATASVSGREYLRGTAPYGSRMLRLLDLPALLTQDSLLVNEKP